MKRNCFATDGFTKADGRCASLRIWFLLSLIFAFGYSLLWLKAAFAGKYIVQSDASMYVFWMQRFVDPTVLPHDFNVAYHSSISPPGYTLLFQGVASLGVPPMLFNKLLPVALTVVTTAYCFYFCLQILHLPPAAFTSTLLLNQHLWLTDDINSATPRSFVYPLFLAFLYYLGQEAKIQAIVAIGLIGLFYPPMMLVAVGVLAVRLVGWMKGQFWLSKQRSDYLLLAAGVTVAGIALVPYGLFGTTEFGPIVTVAQARAMPEFLAPGGRIPFFNDRDPLNFWFTGLHSGFYLSFNPAIVSVSLLLPLLWHCPRCFPLVKQCRSNIVLLSQVLISSTCLFFVAHAWLFQLFMPSRYTIHSLRLVTAIAGGFGLCILIDTAIRFYPWIWQSRKTQCLAWSGTILIALSLIFYPQIFWSKHFAKAGLVVGAEPALYEFFQKQPKDSLIASLSSEADNLPIFAQKSVLVSRKYAIPYHPGYYHQIRQRAIDLIHAQYSLNLAAVQTFTRKYGVDFWLLDKTAFAPDYLNNSWLKQFEPASSEARATLTQAATPILAQAMQRCNVFETESLVVLPVRCVSEEPSKERHI